MLALVTVGLAAFWIAVVGLLIQTSRLNNLEYQMLAALKDAEMGLASVVRNLPHLRAALRESGQPDSWLGGFEPKLERIRAAIKKAEAR